LKSFLFIQKSGHAHPVGQAAHEALAPGQLFQRDPFVGLVRLRNVAGAADDGGHTRLVKQSSFRAKRDLARAAGRVDLGAVKTQLRDLAVGRRGKAGQHRFEFVRDARVGCDGLHGGHQALAKGLGPCKQLFGRVHVVVANLPGHLALARDDVERRAPCDHARVDGGVGHVVDRVERAVLRQFAVHAFQVSDKLAGDLDRVHAQRREGRMRLKTVHRGFVRMLAFVRDHHLHARGLAHDAACGLEALGLHVGDHAAHANAADFFVIAESQMDRALEFSFQQLGHHHQTDRAKTLHVGHAAAVHLVALNHDLERVGVPRLAVDGHHVGVAREHQPTHLGFAVVRWQRGPEVGFLATVVVGAAAGNAQVLQVSLGPIQQGQVAVARDGGKGDPFFDQGQGGQVGGLDRGQGSLRKRGVHGGLRSKGVPTGAPDLTGPSARPRHLADMGRLRLPLKWTCIPPSTSGVSMAIYELRTYSVIVGKMSEVISHYKNEGWPALAKHPPKLVGYFTGDVGAVNELIHVWKFDDDADRRAFWAGVFADPEFMAFAAKIRPLMREQNNKLMLSGPLGTAALSRLGGLMRRPALDFTAPGSPHPRARSRP